MEMQAAFSGKDREMSQGSGFRAKQSGQVLVYCAAMLVVMALTTGYVFNSGQISNEKTRLQNTVDAAAYSVAAVEAKDLNFKAYTNRAMVANHVSIAQSVSLISWARYYDRYAQNITTILKAIPYIGPLFAGAGKVISGLVNAIEFIIGGLVSGVEGVNHVLSHSQHLMHIGTIPLAYETMKNVVEKNDKDVDTSISFKDVVFMDSLRKGHWDFTNQYDPSKVNLGKAGKSYAEHKARMDEFRRVVLDSRDGFSQTRNHTTSSINLLKIKFRVVKAGGTEFLAQPGEPEYYTWAAMDTLSIHRNEWGKKGTFSWGWKGWKETLPVGWGAAQTGQNIAYAGHRGAKFGSTWKTNPTASGLATGENQSKPKVGIYNGLKRFYDIKSEGLLSEAPGVTILVTKPHDKGKINTLKHTDYYLKGSQLDLEAKGGMLKDRMAAFAKAAPSFSRPSDVLQLKRNDSFQEYGNLYNPYWQPRLVELDSSLKDTVITIAATHL